jgi:hypothetical protein
VPVGATMEVSVGMGVNLEPGKMTEKTEPAPRL